MNLRFLLPVGLVAMMGFGAYAEGPEDTSANKMYTTDLLGELNGVADNGRFVVINDSENKMCYMWDSAQPELFKDITIELSTNDTPSAQRIIGSEVYDVSDWGIAVGTIWYNDGHSIPAYYKNGEWIELPVPQNMKGNTVAPTCITPDAKVIGGYYATVVQGRDYGTYFPCRWTRNDQGEYDLEEFSTLELPEHQGFITLCMSKDGRILGGKVYCGMKSEIAALLVDGRLEIFHEISYREEPLYYKGKWCTGYDYDDEGKLVQTWTDDPNDPNILLFREELIDGYHDAAEELTGTFCFTDKDDNFYGRRCQISDVSEDGNAADVQAGACIYNEGTDLWIDNDTYEAYTCGTDPDHVYTNYNSYVVNGEATDVPVYYDLSFPENKYGISFGASKISLDGTVIGCVRGVFNDAIEDYDYYPYIIVTDKFSGVQQTFGGERPFVVASHGVINVHNAQEAELFDLNGMLLGRGLSFEPGAGMYIVRTGDITVKVAL